MKNHRTKEDILTNMVQKNIEIKGSVFTLPIIEIFSTNTKKCIEDLKTKISKAPSFFSSKAMLLNFKNPAIKNHKEINLNDLKKKLIKLEIFPVGIISDDEIILEQAKKYDLAIFKDQSASNKKNISKSKDSKDSKDKKDDLAKNEKKMPKTTTIAKHIRSGQQVYAKGADLVILGNVSNGAEIISDGSIHIYGSLRGRAFAGVQGNSSARIYCQDLQPELVSIDGQFWLSDAVLNYWRKPGCVYINEEKLKLTSLS